VPRVRVVLQARTTSSRLPAKTLLPLAGQPLAILCARRLSSCGREVVLAIPDESSDNLLARTAADAGFRVHRGSLDDVLDRFLGCISDLLDDDLVVRATADNPVPDGEFVEALIAEFHRCGGEYLGTHSPHDGLPYGLSAEVFTAGALRRAAAQANDPYDREHVTPCLRRASGASAVVRRGAFLVDDQSMMRVTIDTLSDYLAMARVFPQAGGEIVSWRWLVGRVGQGERARVAATLPGEHLTLGTAQLGSHYGIANRTGRPDEREARAILAAAIEGGITQLDTARAYGDAEARIGRLVPGSGNSSFQVTTKLRPLSELPEDASQQAIVTQVDASLYGSCRDLDRRTIDVIMFHRGADMLRCNGAALERLAQRAEEGVVRELGVSVYTTEEAARALADPRVTHIQIPFNLLDWRWDDAEFQRSRALRPHASVHVRSVFLQGLLVSGPEIWPRWLNQAPQIRSSIDDLVRSLQRQGPADLCMAYVRAHPWVRSLVLGVETASQLRELLALAQLPPLSLEGVAAVRERFRDIPERLLSPQLW
jgi:spore coat polysaccharide biosynthesis protein SpsF (cytidylyltransferase family)/aryl-alcohol dehydrogenase-like predicted oxidoreductase